MVICAVLAIGCGPKSSDGVLRGGIDPAKTYPPATELRRGINLGNALDAPKEGAWGVRLRVEHFQLAKQSGLDHVRLPVRFSNHAADKAPYTIDTTFLERVDWAIDQALANGLSVILDMHHYEQMMKDPQGHTERFLAMWKQLAERYRSLPSGVLFEILNEPTDKLVTPLWNDIAARCIQTIRAVDPSRTIIVDSTFWAAAKELDGLKLPEDPAVVASFHMYQPILFTHQGASFMGAEYQTVGIVFPGPPAKPVEPVRPALAIDWVKSWFEKYNTLPIDTNPSGERTLAEEFGHVDAFIARTGKRVYMGEFAVVRQADEASRSRWLRRVRDEAERRKIPWAYWDDGGGTRAMNVKQGTWVPSIRDAILGP